MADRKAELAAKKKKLEELRKQRESRYGSSDPTSSVRAPSIDVTELVSSLLGDTATKSKLDEAPEEKKSARRPGARSRLRSRANLTKSETKLNSWAPPELIVYAKTTQTEFSDSPSALAAKKEEEEEEKELQRKAQEERRQLEEQRKKEEHERSIKALQEREQEEQKPSVMAPEKVNEILSSADFQSFFEKSSKLIERALNEPYDVCVDYARDENSGDGEGQTGNDVRLVNTFYHPRYSANRVVTCMDWSTKHPELLVASYNANEDAPNDPDGIVLVWNTHLKSTPEFVFECQSSVLSCCFSPWQPNIVIGGTYSGQIVLWDNRSKRTPEQRSALSAQAHTHPVYCLDLVGTQNAHNLVSVSTDGKLCTWNLDMLTTPTSETLDLQLGANKPVAPTCMSFPKGDINNFVVGSEEGALYAASRHNTKAGLVGEVFEGHSGPVTSVDFHKAAGGSSDFSHLFLSSSTDWTVKLWSYRSKTPIYSFEDAGDYVLDVQWSPIHPSLFASADGMGQIDFWNPNTETEAPVKSVDVDEGKHAINRIKWSNNGHQIAAGDAMGRLHIYELSEKLAVPRPDEWSRFKDTLVELQQSAVDIEAVASGATTLAP